MQNILSYILDRVTKLELQHEIHNFDSGAIMVDLCVKNNFYCVQIDDVRIGLSLIEDDPAFTTVPDKSYNDIETFKIDFEKILAPADM